MGDGLSKLNRLIGLIEDAGGRGGEGWRRGRWYNLAGVGGLARERFVPSLEQLRELLKAEPEDGFLRYGVAMAYMKEGRYDEAIGEFEELIRRDPKYVAAYFMGGQAMQQKGDLAKAKAMYERGIAAAKQAGDDHAASKIGDALGLLEQVMK